MHNHTISPETLTLEALEIILDENTILSLSDASVDCIQACRRYLDEKVRTQSEPIYGVTTGFGSLCNTSISHDELGDLQKNLVMSHACGTGEEVPLEIVRLMLFLKIQSLSYGHS